MIFISKQKQIQLIFLYTKKNTLISYTTIKISYITTLHDWKNKTQHKTLKKLQLKTPLQHLKQHCNLKHNYNLKHHCNMFQLKANDSTTITLQLSMSKALDINKLVYQLKYKYVHL